MSDIAHPLPTTCFLPLRRRTLARHLGKGSAPDTALEQAGLLAAQLCRRQAQPAAQIERLLHEACTLFAAHPAAAAAQLAGPGGQGQEELEAWLAELAARGVLLAPEATLQPFLDHSPEAYPGLALQAACQETLAEHSIRFPAAFASDDEDDRSGGDDSDATAGRALQRTGLYTREQAQVLRAIAANPDELIDLDAYAGTGKSHLVLELMDTRPGRYTYVAPSRGQVEAFRARVPATTAARLLTQIEFANALAQHAARSGITGGFVPVYRQSTLWPRDIASRIGVRGIGQRTPEQVLLTAFDAINRWCADAAPTLQPWHFGRSVPWALLDAAPWIAAAEHVWRCMFDPVVQKGGCLSLTVAHIGKWLSLHGVVPPQEMGTILVDEAHDLSPAWKRLLAAHAPGVVSLGDPHQRLSGRADRWTSAKRLEMHHSVRQGSQVDTMVNHALSLDEGDGERLPFEGATDRATGVREYAHWQDVPLQGLRVHGSLWRLLHDTVALQAQGAQVHVHPASLRLLQKEAHAPIDAWRTAREGGPSHRWEAFVAACQQRGLDDVPALFSGGFDALAMARLMAALVPAQDSSIVLCLAQHAKNLQFDVVTLSACCFNSGHDGRLPYSPVRAAYLAMTRASRQLWLPGDAMAHLQDSAQRHALAREAQRARRRQGMGNGPTRH